MKSVTINTRGHADRHYWDPPCVCDISPVHNPGAAHNPFSPYCPQNPKCECPGSSHRLDIAACPLYDPPQGWKVAGALATCAPLAEACAHPLADDHRG